MFSNKLFKKYCSDDWLSVFDANKSRLHFKAKQRIFKEGDPVKGIYFIEQGKVKVLSRLNTTEEKIIRIAGNDMLLGHRGIHFKQYHISAETLTDTTVTFLPINVFVKIIKANPDMALYLLYFLTEELRDAEDRLKNLLILDPKKRVALILINLIESFGYSVKKSHLLSYTLSRKDIANMAGTTYETIIRTLAHLQDLKLIELSGKDIIIKNEIQLKKFATDNQIKK